MEPLSSKQAVKKVLNIKIKIVNTKKKRNIDIFSTSAHPYAIKNNRFDYSNGISNNSL